jgi:dynamin family protein
VVPVTALPIFVAYGVTAALQIHYRDDRPHEELCADQGGDLRARLFAVAAEAANPRNRLGVARIEVFFPSPILAGGTVFVDTPGIGSTHQHNTETAFRLLPECDAGLFVLSADPPITEAELSYLAEVRKQVRSCISCSTRWTT